MYLCQNCYCDVIILEQEFVSKVWRFEAGKLLTKAIGFGPPINLIGADGVSRPLISLASLSTISSATKRLPDEVINILNVKRNEIDAEIIALDGAPSIAAIIRMMCEKNPPDLVRSAAEAALTYVGNLLATPKDLRMYRVKQKNPFFQRTIGCLSDSDLLMRAIGFFPGNSDVAGQENESNVIYVLRQLGDNAFDPKIAITLTEGENNKDG
jgi:hypothetical protein